MTPDSRYGMETVTTRAHRREISAEWISALLSEDSASTRRLCREVLEKACPSLPWTHAAFLLGTSTGDHEVFAAFRRKGSRASSVAELEILSPRLRLAWKSGKTDLVADYRELARSKRGRAAHLGLRGLLIVPARGEDQNLAAIYLDSRTSAFRPGKREFLALESAAKLFADWAAVRARALASPRDLRFLEMGRNGFALIHDLRNLFTLLYSRLQWMEIDAQNREKGLAALREEIRLGRSRLEEILQHGAGGETETLDLAQLLPAAIERVPLLRAGEARVLLQPHVAEPFTIRGRRGQLLDALTNILLNAADAGGGDGSIEVQLFREPSGIWVRITDRGSGMGPEQLRRLFEPMRRSHKEGSVGLGLFSTRKILESHGGSVSVHSSSHVGTTVTLVFPAWEESSREKRILLVEDEEDEAIEFARAIDTLPCRLEIVTDEKRAIARAREGGFDLIVLDLGMPRRNGAEILEELRRRGIRVPALLLSARPGAWKRSLEPVAPLRKPLAPEAIREAIRSQLSLSANSSLQF